jgi:mono/diheme cytochrome c family protein
MPTGHGHQAAGDFIVDDTQVPPFRYNFPMKTRLLGAAALSAALAAGCGLLGNEGERQAAVVDAICVDCHNATDEVAGLNLEALRFDAVAADAEVWEKVIRKVRAGLMPPADGGPTLEREAREELVAYLENEIDTNAPVHLPAPGLHRLNRAEYTNAVRDLLALNIDAATFLPPDDSSHGFDNMAGTLTTSPALMEAYLSAAGKISRLGLGTETAPTLAVFDAPHDTSQNGYIEGLPFGTRGGMLIEHEFPADGNYVFTVKGMTGYFTAVLGNVKGEKLEVTIDGARVYLYDWDTEIGNTESNGGRTPPIPIKAGFHKVGVTFIATSDLPDTGLNKSFVRTMNSPGAISGYTFYPHVGQVFIEGPYDGLVAASTQSRDKIFECYPNERSQESQCARTIISTLAGKAFRRPATEADLEAMMAFFQDGREEGGSFDYGIEAVVQRILADPEFIYRRELEPPGVAPGSPYGISDLELASRLSFFLWSSIPDDELIELASEGRLHDTQVLERQVERMIADPRSDAFIENFTGQWLNVRGMQASEPVVDLFPDFDSTLRQAFRREIELFFGSVIHEDRSILDLLTADYTFVNERLAKHYGIPAVYGAQFRRVTLGPELDMRRGLLGKGALLTITSDAARTSPVKRGKWFLETFLGLSPPDPPPGVETDLKPVEGEAPKTLRARLEAHRINPTCVSCHQIFEPMGLAMENFDGVGAWRTLDAGQPIDPTGVTNDGTPLDGVRSLREFAVENGDVFAQTVTEKLLTYAIGRGLEYEDMPLVRSIMHDAAEDDYRFSSLLMGVIRSPAFTMNVKTAANTE